MYRQADNQEKVCVAIGIILSCLNCDCTRKEIFYSVAARNAAERYRFFSSRAEVGFALIVAAKLSAQDPKYTFKCATSPREFVCSKRAGEIG